MQFIRVNEVERNSVREKKRERERGGSVSEQVQGNG